MKRELNCPECAEQWQKVTPVNYPGFNNEDEGMRQVLGVVCVDGAVCDGCNEALPAGTTAVATSLYSRQNPYFEWEGELVTVERDLGRVLT